MFSCREASGRFRIVCHRCRRLTRTGTIPGTMILMRPACNCRHWRTVFALVAGLAVFLVWGHGQSAPGRSQATSGRAERRPKLSPRGNVVRVARERQKATAKPRICNVPFDGQGTCFGNAPAIGDRATLFDYESNYLGELRIVGVTPSQLDTCGSGSIHDFRYEVGGGSRAAPVPAALAVFGMELDAKRSRIITDMSKLPTLVDTLGAQPVLGIDRDGDGSMELILAVRDCRDVAPPPSAGNASRRTFCIEYWMEGAGERFSRAHQEHFHACL